MGAYVIILPDRKYINTADITDFGNIDAAFTTQADVQFQLCRLDGEVQTPKYTQANEPENPQSMDLWMDISGTAVVLKQWSGSAGMWVDIPSTYVRISSPGIGNAFHEYDGVDITGLKGEQTDTDGNTVPEIGELAALEGSTVIWSRGEDYIVVTGILSSAYTIGSKITVERKMPDMDFVVECRNRLWGCRYGVSAEGEIVNEIYCSKLGDFKNWRCYMGLSTDSWAGSIGTDGKFTGAITHMGYPLFFKENCLHKVYTSEVGAHSIQDTVCRGVQDGCGRSLAIVGETLLYKTRSGICAYDGSLPQEVSAELGGVSYYNAVGGSHGSKYYVQMEDGEGKQSIFAYDLAKDIWHRETGIGARGFCACRGQLYAIDGDGDLQAMLAEDGEQTDWLAESGIMGASDPDAKYLHRLVVRMALSPGGEASFYVEYDSSGDWEYICTMHGTGTASFQVPLRVRRCDHLRLKMEGCGDVKVFSITKVWERGSDVF
jgi:hypothetical protein